MVTTVIFFLGLLTIVYAVLLPVYSAMQTNQQKVYDERFKAFRVLWLRKYYPEAREIPIHVLYQNIERLDPLYDAIGRNHLESVG